jgi:hypothetical protein
VIFKSYALRTESEVSYELAYYDEAGERHNLEKEIRRAIDWCDRELLRLKKNYEGPPDSTYCAAATRWGGAGREQHRARLD